MSLCNNRRNAVTRRDMLKQFSGGFGMLALAGLVGENDAKAAATVVSTATKVAEKTGAANPLAPKAPMFPAKAKRVIYLFMHGGPSQVDTFDPKPMLTRDHGKPLPFAKPRVTFAGTGNLLKSPWEFKQYGQSGTPVSELFPEVAKFVDDMCVVRSMKADNNAHGGALLQMHTGSDSFVRPSMGSWAVYGLGTENQNLPGFITICPTLGHGGVQNWSSAFLPAYTQGTPIGNASIPAEKANFAYINNPDSNADLQRMQLDLLRDMGEDQLKHFGHDPNLEGRIQSFELAYRMQTEGPGLMDISGESKATLDLYGIGDKNTDNFGRQCLLARRFAEKGVRFIQCTHSYKWDQHGNLKGGHTQNAKEVDKPIAGLLADLKAHGMLEDTLVLWGGEFGRTPVAQGDDGRDHNPNGFSVWMAGGGVKPGSIYGATDDYGYYATQNVMHVHDLHATILHLLGMDHLKLTYRYGGRDFRLTDVYGEVAHDVVA